MRDEHLRNAEDPRCGDEPDFFRIGITRYEYGSGPPLLEQASAARVPGDRLDGAARHEERVAAVERADDPKGARQSTRWQEDGKPTESGETNQRLQKLLDRPELDSLLKDASGAVAGLRRTAESPSLTNSVAQLQRTLRRFDQLAAGKDNDLEIALGNLRLLTENLKELSENAKRFPAQLLFGEPPKPATP